jgi:hypothetical protein
VSAAEALVSTAETLTPSAKTPWRIVGVRRRTPAAEGSGLPAAEGLEAARVARLRSAIRVGWIRIRESGSARIGLWCGSPVI